MPNPFNMAGGGSADALLAFLRQPFGKDGKSPFMDGGLDLTQPFRQATNMGLNQPFSGGAPALNYNLRPSALPMPTNTPQARPSQPAPPSVQPVSQPPIQGPANNVGDDGLDHSSREGYIRSVLPYAMAAESSIGIPADLASLMIAININEQGHSKNAPGNNVFGIKGKNPKTGKSFMTPTWEVYNGVRHDIQDEFRAYDNIAESYADFWNFLTTNARYRPALEVLRRTNDPAQFIRAVQAAGYATDPNWANQVISIMKQVQAVRGM